MTITTSLILASLFFHPQGDSVLEEITEISQSSGFRILTTKDESFESFRVIHTTFVHDRYGVKSVRFLLTEIDCWVKIEANSRHFSGTSWYTYKISRENFSDEFLKITNLHLTQDDQ